ncbi:unnamed protein product [Clonostachys rhizophaga]|uniref:Uncharacterized protein n=1 Tax=Clonostachys rhizophaga TaxID=160324 RepID=A0A9N9VGV6_9HYPO|nr:unnamed protein product [Clonostachys rhizophaga]
MKSIIALTAALFLGATTMARPFTGKAGDYDICWLLCASDKIQCPEGWYSSQQGDCWTCCKDTSAEGITVRPASLVELRR